METDYSVSIDGNLCSKCGLCRDDCVSHVITLTDEGARVSQQGCIRCGHCVAICPQNAVTLSCYEDSPNPLEGEWRVDPHALLHQIKGRRSMRQFTNEEVSRETLMRVIEAGRYTPTGSNKQDVSYVVLLENKEIYEATALSFMQKTTALLGIFSSRFRHIKLEKHFLFKQAPAVIVIKASNLVDGALAASSMELMAQSLGLGALYSGFFTRAARSSRKLKRMLGVSSGEKVVTTLVLGYPAVTYQRTAPRKQPVIVFD